MEGNLNFIWLGLGLEFVLFVLLFDECLVDLVVLNVWMEFVDFYVFLLFIYGIDRYCIVVEMILEFFCWWWRW